MSTRQLAALCAFLLLAAGCGGSHQSDLAQIRQALTASRASYLHYTSPTWWGHRVRAELRATTFDGEFALARVELPSGAKLWSTQWSLLRRHASGWRVLATAVRDKRSLPCAAAPPSTMRELAGGCSKLPDGEAGAISGPMATRPARAAEQAAITAVARKGHRGSGSCITWHVRVSKVDPQYALVDARFPTPLGECLKYAFNGAALLVHSAAGWRVSLEGSGGWPCDGAPAGVIRSFFGVCLLRTRG